MFDVLKKVAEEFNDASLSWALGGSLILYYNKLVDTVNDIDLIVAKEDYEAASNILQRMGRGCSVPSSDIFLTDGFSKYMIDGIRLDLMAGFKIKSDVGIYSYILDQMAISRKIKLGGVEVPLGSLEDWYVLYSLMPNREPKISMLYNHLVGNPYETLLLERALSQALPMNIKENILSILKK